MRRKQAPFGRRNGQVLKTYGEKGDNVVVDNCLCFNWLQGGIYLLRIVLTIWKRSHTSGAYRFSGMSFKMANASAGMTPAATRALAYSFVHHWQLWWIGLPSASWNEKPSADEQICIYAFQDNLPWLREFFEVLGQTEQFALACPQEVPDLVRGKRLDLSDSQLRYRRCLPEIPLPWSSNFPEDRNCVWNGD